MATGASGNTAIRARGLTRRFGDHVALDRLDLAVPERTTFGLLGENGAGKTTFIRLLTGFLLPSAGDVAVFGVSAATQPDVVHRNIGFVMETSRLYPELRVHAFLRFCGGIRNLGGDALETAVASAMERFQLGAVRQRLIGNLSKGYQQRVSLAQAFLHDPALVIVDEPTSGLDPVQQRDVQDVLASLGGEHTVLLCTHDLREAETLTDQVAVLRSGRLIAEGPTGEILGTGDALALFRPGEDPA
ncbi:MAG: ABC transporter ATP-binding protein [Myxococcota bacterium]|nr:ABC transporter ATP-binding protein [Myxococcota bacterium]